MLSEWNLKEKKTETVLRILGGSEHKTQLDNIINEPPIKNQIVKPKDEIVVG